MQFKNLAFSLFVATVAADTVSDLVATIPTCSLTCLMNGATTIGCGVADYTCQCKKADDLTKAATSCVAAACSTADLISVSTISSEICVAVAAAAASSGVSSAVASVTSSVASAATAVTSTTTSATKNAAPTAAMDAGMLLGAAAIMAMAL